MSIEKMEYLSIVGLMDDLDSSIRLGQLITKLLCCIISSVAGGIIGVNLRID